MLCFFKFIVATWAPDSERNAGGNVGITWKCETQGFQKFPKPLGAAELPLELDPWALAGAEGGGRRPTNAHIHTHRRISLLTQKQLIMQRAPAASQPVRKYG